MAHVALGKILKMCNEILSLMARNRSSEQASLLVRATPGKIRNNVLVKKKGALNAKAQPNVGRSRCKLRECVECWFR